MKRDDAIHKIKACIARAASTDSENEAAIALRQAAAMMREQGLSENDLDAAEITEASVGIGQRIPEWKKALARHITHAFGCYFFLSYGYKKASIRFVGRGAAPELCEWAYEVCIKACLRQKDHFLLRMDGDRTEKMAHAKVFCKGWVYGLRTQINKFADEASAYTPKTNKVLAEYLETKYSLSTVYRGGQRELSMEELETFVGAVEEGSKHSLHVPVDESGNPISGALPPGAGGLLGHGQ
jgi:hypothetical protein